LIPRRPIKGLHYYSVFKDPRPFQGQTRMLLLTIRPVNLSCPSCELSSTVSRADRVSRILLANSSAWYFGKNRPCAQTQQRRSNLPEPERSRKYPRKIFLPMPINLNALKDFATSRIHSELAGRASSTCASDLPLVLPRRHVRLTTCRSIRFCVSPSRASLAPATPRRRARLRRPASQSPLTNPP